MKIVKYLAVVSLMTTMSGCFGMYGKNFQYQSDVLQSGKSATLNVSLHSVTNSLIPSFKGPEYTLSLYQDPEGKCAKYSFPKPEHGYMGDIAVDLGQPDFKTQVNIPTGKPLYIRSLFINGGEMMCDQVYRFTPEVGKEYFFDFQQEGRNEFLSYYSAKCKVELAMMDSNGEMVSVPGKQYHNKSDQFLHYNRLCEGPVPF